MKFIIEVKRDEVIEFGPEDSQFELAGLEEGVVEVYAITLQKGLTAEEANSLLSQLAFKPAKIDHLLRIVKKYGNELLLTTGKRVYLVATGTRDKERDGTEVMPVSCPSCAQCHILTFKCELEISEPYYFLGIKE